MLERFEVEGFRNFGHRFVLDLSDVRDYRFNSDAIEDGVVKTAVIYGKNAVGKTNLCNALFDLSSNVGHEIKLRDESNYLSADCGSSEARFSYSFKFKSGSVRYEYSKRARRQLIRESLWLDGALAFSFDHGIGSVVDGDLAAIGAENLNWAFKPRDASAFNYICNNVADPLNRSSLFDAFRFARTMNPISDAYLSNRTFVSGIVDYVIEQGLVGELEGFLGSFGIEEGLVVRYVPSGERVLYFNKKNRLVPFVENCSSGTIALLRLFNFDHRVEPPSLLFVDEFDAFYHFDLAERVVSYFRESSGRQVICASHNTDLFSNKVLRPDCLFILSPERIISAANATRRELREGHNLEKLYKSGEFDG